MLVSNILYVLYLICHSAALNFIYLNHKVLASLYSIHKAISEVLIVLDDVPKKLKWLNHIFFPPNR